jgi:hypothetical protein
MPTKIEWTDEKDAVIRRVLAGAGSWDEAAEALGYSRQTVLERAAAAGIRRPRPAEGEGGAAAPRLHSDRGREPMAAGHGVSWGAITRGTCMEGVSYDGKWAGSYGFGGRTGAAAAPPGGPEAAGPPCVEATPGGAAEARDEQGETATEDHYGEDHAGEGLRRAKHNPEYEAKPEVRGAPFDVKRALRAFTVDRLTMSQMHDRFGSSEGTFRAHLEEFQEFRDELARRLALAADGKAKRAKGPATPRRAP